jgi:hypothetical protein
LSGMIKDMHALILGGGGGYSPPLLDLRVGITPPTIIFSRGGHPPPPVYVKVGGTPSRFSTP